jgi:hypothetical protein
MTREAGAPSLACWKTNNLFYAQKTLQHNGISTDSDSAQSRLDGCWLAIAGISDRRRTRKLPTGETQAARSIG